MIGLSAAKMEELNLFRGDTVMVKGKKGRSTVCIVLTEESTEDSNVRMNKVRYCVLPCRDSRRDSRRAGVVVWIWHGVI